MLPDPNCWQLAIVPWGVTPTTKRIGPQHSSSRVGSTTVRFSQIWKNFKPKFSFYYLHAWEWHKLTPQSWKAREKRENGSLPKIIELAPRQFRVAYSGTVNCRLTSREDGCDAFISHIQRLLINPNKSDSLYFMMRVSNKQWFSLKKLRLERKTFCQASVLHGRVMAHTQLFCITTFCVLLPFFPYRWRAPNPDLGKWFRLIISCKCQNCYLCSQCSLINLCSLY